MKKRWIIASGALVATVVVAVTFTVQYQERRAIDASVFVQMQKNPWDLQGELLWGYFFTNDSKRMLEVTARSLERLGYKPVSIHEDEKKQFWWLHVERVERHTLNSMASRNVRLSWFGKLLGGSVYDGWDVGQVGFSPKKATALEPTTRP